MSTNNPFANPDRTIQPARRREASFSRSTDWSLVPSMEFARIPMNELRVVADNNIGIGGMTVSTTARFWASLTGLIGVPKSVFNLFSHQEVFERAVAKRNDKGRDVMVTVAVENGTRALAVTSDSACRFSPKGLETVAAPLMEEGLLKAFSYSDGQIILYRDVAGSFEFGKGDHHNPEVALQIPMDGYGQMQSFVAMLRQVCSNGMVAMSSAFRSPVPSSKNLTPAVTVQKYLRHVDEHGIMMLKSRIDESLHTSASIAMAMELLRSLRGEDEKVNSIRRGLAAVIAPKLSEIGVVTLTDLPHKLRANCPIGLSAYQLIQIATECATHYTPNLAPRLFGLVGDWLGSDSFDLEGVKPDKDVVFENAKAFYLQAGDPEKAAALSAEEASILAEA
jgi:hypothetical protein